MSSLIYAFIYVKLLKWSYFCALNLARERTRLEYEEETVDWRTLRGWRLSDSVGPVHLWLSGLVGPVHLWLSGLVGHVHLWLSGFVGPVHLWHVC